MRTNARSLSRVFAVCVLSIAGGWGGSAAGLASEQVTEQSGATRVADRGAPARVAATSDGYLELNMCGSDCPGTTAQKVSEIATEVLAARPQAIALNEVCGRQLTALRTELSNRGYPMTESFVRTKTARGSCSGDSFGEAVFVRGPVLDVDRVTFDAQQSPQGEQRAMICVLTETTVKERVCSTHLVPGAIPADVRAQQVRQVARVMSAYRYRTVLMGDFNTTPTNNGLDPLYSARHGGGATGRFTEVYANATGGACRCGAATRDSGKIDYIFVTDGGLDPVSRSVKNLQWSDHHLVRGTVTVR